MKRRHTPLISAEDLQALRDAGKPVVVIDASFDLADPEAGERSWREAHLAGSTCVHLDRDLSGARTGANGRHPLPERAALAATLGRLGVRPETQVVALDRQGGVYAARVWWLLRWMGHDGVAVLDGGLDAWRAAGGAVDTGAVETPPGAPQATEAMKAGATGTPPTAAERIESSAAGVAPYPERPPLVATIDADALAASLGTVALIDARAAERFRGDVEPLDRVAGHIPGALNRFHKANLRSDGRFKGPAELRAEFTALLGAVDPARTVHQCGSGVTACHNLLAMEHAGLIGTRLYPGSWSEWSADPQRPIARGG